MMRINHQSMSESEMEGRARDKRLEENGLLDSGQPTETAHIDHVRSIQAEFSPRERRLIRAALFGSPAEGD